MKKYYIKWKFISKIVVGTGILSVWIFLNIKQAWINEQTKYGIINESIENSTEIKPTESQNQATQEQLDESNKILLTMIKQEFSQTHWAWDSLDYNDNLYSKLCKWYNQICDRTIFNWEFTYKQKIVYQWTVIFLVRTIDKYLVTGQKLYSNLYSIRLNKTWTWRRWFAWHHSININLTSIKNTKELKEVLTHEMWHIIDLWIINWTSKTKDSDYTEFWEESFAIDDWSLEFYNLSWLSENVKKDISSFKDFVSWYWLTDPFEDFAECVNLYLNHYKLFETMSKSNYILSQKFEYMKQLFWNKYIFSDQANLTKLKYDSSRRPWDSTKIK